LDEADRLCERIGIFKTRLITLDTPANLRKRLYGRKIVFHLKRLEPAWVEMLSSLPFVKEAQAIDSKLVLGLDNPEDENPIILRRLVEAGAEVQFVGELRHSLEEVYLKLLNTPG
jgi:ABC-2 type transport system ATP-binding protein